MVYSLKVAHLYNCISFLNSQKPLVPTTTSLVPTAIATASETSNSARGGLREDEHATMWPTPTSSSSMTRPNLTS